MLVLGRKPGTKILIGDNIIVEVVRITRRRAYLGVTAPEEVAVDREEIRKDKELDAIQAEREAGKT